VVKHGMNNLSELGEQGGKWRKSKQENYPETSLSTDK
jgi:hypothetical protein